LSCITLDLCGAQLALLNRQWFDWYCPRITVSSKCLEFYLQSALYRQC
jgi:hypothetical protein